MGSSASIHDTTHGTVGIHEIYTLLQNDSSLRNTFCNYLTNEFQDSMTFIATPFDFTSEYQKIVRTKAQYLLTSVFASPPSPTLEVKSVLRANLENQTFDSLSLTDINFLKSVNDCRKEILTVVIIGTFSNFLKSEEYQRWFWTRESPSNLSTPFQSLFSQFHLHDFDSITKSSWLQTICHAFDNLPISISIADATQRRFPLIYVNSAFQEMSGFTLQEVIGKSNKFLQKAAVEESMGHIMTTTLGAGEPCRVFISNKRKDDTPFRSLLSMKPVHSLDGTYRLVIGMQFDVTNKYSSSIALCIANDLFQALPATCPNDIIGDVKSALSPQF